MGNRVHEFYLNRQSNTNARLVILKRRLRQISILRILAFITILLPFGLIPTLWPVAVSLSVASAAMFLWLIKLNIRLEREKKKCEILSGILDNEIKALDYQFLEFPDGSEFGDPHHAYTSDLDIFGKGSVYQMINRTTTRGGSQKLARLLQDPLQTVEAVIRRQESVKEIAELRDWRLEFLSEGNLLDVSESQMEILLGGREENLTIRNYGILKKALILLPALNLGALAWMVAGGTHLWLVLAVLFNWGLIYRYRKEIANYYNLFGNKTVLVGKYLAILKVIDGQEFRSKELRELQEKVRQSGGAAKIISELRNIMLRFEYRQNIIPGIVLNSLLLWDLRCVFQLKGWHETHQESLSVWLETAETFDALTGPGIFADHHPEFSYPLPLAGDFSLKAEKLGHPILRTGKRVDNDFQLEGWSRVVIITGANMAGKSTFLRALGVNMVLAGSGCPVCAAKMEYSPAGLFTSMRTTDSLLLEESYFLAELKRIATLMNRLRNGEQLVVILDEMLKGTNSEDKLKGSQNLVRELSETSSVSIIATHDVKLTEMEQELPGHVSNYCFEIKHQGEELVFDYKLREGVTQNMNATLLMKKMGITR